MNKPGRTNAAKKGAQRYYFLIAAAVIFLGLLVWFLSHGSAYKAGYKGPVQPEYLKGVVIKNTPADQDSLGGDSYLEVLGEDNSVYTVYYARPSQYCTAPTAGSQGTAAPVGEKVSVYGIKTGDKEFTVCSSDFFYIDSIAQTGPYAEWKTFSDPVAGYQFKYPDNWTLSTSTEAEGRVVVLSPPEAQTPMIRVTVIPGASDFTLDEWAESFYGISADAEQTAEVGGVDAIVFPISEDSSSHNVLLAKSGDRIIQFEFPDPQAVLDKDSVALPALIIESVLFDQTASSSVAQPNEGGMLGTVKIGPVCPVQMSQASSSECANQPYQAALRIKNQDGFIVKRVTTAADGTFSISLPPGVYTVENDSSDPVPSLAPQKVVVPPKTIVQATIIFDSGIR